MLKNYKVSSEIKIIIKNEYKVILPANILVNKINIDLKINIK